MRSSHRPNDTSLNAVSQEKNHHTDTGLCLLEAAFRVGWTVRENPPASMLVGEKPNVGRTE